MNQTLHILKKDVKRLRWPLAGWIVVVAGHMLARTITLAAPLTAPGSALAMQNLSTLFTWIEALMLALIVSLLVHDEPLVGADAFWLTRPIDRSALVAAKLVSAAGFVILLPLAVELGLVATLGPGPRDAIRAVPSFLLAQALWVALLFALATLTPSPIRFLLTVIGGVAAIAAALSATITVALLLEDLDASSYYTSPLPDDTTSIVSRILLMCVCGSVIIYQYRNRRVRRAIILGTIGFVAALVAGDTWPWRFAKAAEPDPGSWARDEARTAAVLDLNAPPNVSESFFSRATIVKKQVAAPMHLSGVPSEYWVQSVGIRARLQMPDGAILESAERMSVGVRRPGERPSTRVTHIQGAIPQTRVLAAEDSGYEEWPVILAVNSRDYERYGRESGRLTAAADFYLSRVRAVGSLPLVSGATLRDGSAWFMIVSILRAGDACTVLMRRSGRGPLTKPESARQYEFLLHNRERDEAVFGSSQPLTENGFQFGPWSVASGHEMSEGVTLHSAILLYPERGPLATRTSSITASWLSGAELLVIETAYAGRVARTLTVDGFRMRQGN